MTDSDAERRREALLRYVEALVGAAALCERQRLVVTLTPESFALQWDERLRTRYVGHAIEPGDALDIVGPLLEQCQDFADDELAQADLVEVLCSGLLHAPHEPERRTALRQSFIDAAARVDGPASKRVCKAAAMVLARPVA